MKGAFSNNTLTLNKQTGNISIPMDIGGGGGGAPNLDLDTYSWVQNGQITITGDFFQIVCRGRKALCIQYSSNTSNDPHGGDDTAATEYVMDLEYLEACGLPMDGTATAGIQVGVAWVSNDQYMAIVPICTSWFNTSNAPLSIPVYKSGQSTYVRRFTYTSSSTSWSTAQIMVSGTSGLGVRIYLGS